MHPRDVDRLTLDEFHAIKSHIDQQIEQEGT